MKRFLSSLLALCLLLTLAACGVGTPQTLGDTISLDESAVLSAETLAQLKENRRVVELRGSDGGVNYTWTVFGTQIGTPRACNFSVKVEKATPKKIVLRFSETQPFDFSPLLSLELPWTPDADVAAVYHGKEAAENYLCAAAVQTPQTAVLSFSVSDPRGVYTIVPVPRDTEPAAAALREEDATLPATTAPATEAQPSTAPPAATTAAAATTAPRSAATTAAPAKPTQRVTERTTQPSTAPRTTQPSTVPQTTRKETTTPTTEAPSPHCTFSIECQTIFRNLDALAPGKLDALPPDGVILPAQDVAFTPGESVFDVLQRVCRENGIPMESTFTPMYRTAYVEGIHNLYEFDCGPNSGWMYRVNGWYPNYGCSLYTLKGGDVVEFRYTCDLGSDIGGRNDFTN